MKKFKKALLIFVTVLSSIPLLGALVLFYVANDTQVAQSGSDALGLSQSQYTQLAAQEILDRWECLPDNEREHFMLDLIKRFAWEDRQTIDMGRRRKQVLEDKEKAGTLNVAERAELNSGYYTPDPKLSRNEHFQPSTCSTGCVTPHMELSLRKYSIWDHVQKPAGEPELYLYDVSAVYEDKYVRWATSESFTPMLSEENDAMMKGELKRRSEALEAEEARRQRLRTQAHEAVSTMKASEVPAGSEGKFEEAEYRKLLCGRS